MPQPRAYAAGEAGQENLGNPEIAKRLEGLSDEEEEHHQQQDIGGSRPAPQLQTTFYQSNCCVSQSLFAFCTAPAPRDLGPDNDWKPPPCPPPQLSSGAKAWALNLQCRVELHVLLRNFPLPGKNGCFAY